jgi:hypothetical protein
MCPTYLGRIQTRTAILLGPAIIGALLSIVLQNEGYVVLIGIYYLIGVALDLTFYPVIIKWQPPWLTFVLGFGEFVIVYVLAQALDVGLTPIEAIVWYWVAWVVAVWTGIVVLPIVSLTWIESGGEFRQTGWSVTPESEPMPLMAAVESRPRGPGGLVREFSTASRVPRELADVPAPSRVYGRPKLPA